MKKNSGLFQRHFSNWNSILHVFSSMKKIHQLMFRRSFFIVFFVLVSEILPIFQCSTSRQNEKFQIFCVLKIDKNRCRNFPNSLDEHLVEISSKWKSSAKSIDHFVRNQIDSIFSLAKREKIESTENENLFSSFRHFERFFDRSVRTLKFKSPENKSFSSNFIRDKKKKNRSRTISKRKILEQNVDHKNLFGYVVISRDFKDQNEAQQFLELIGKLTDFSLEIFKSIKIARRFLLYDIWANNQSIFAENITNSILNHRKIFEKKFGFEIVDAASGNSTENSQIISESNDGSRVVSIILIISSLALLLIIGFSLLCAIHGDENVRRQWIDHSNENNRFLTENSSKKKATEKTPFTNPTFNTKLDSSPKKSFKDLTQNSSSSSKTVVASSENKINHNSPNFILSEIENQYKNRHNFEKTWKILSDDSLKPNENLLSIASSERNIKKNRYFDSVPYDHVRVQLVDYDADGDYINASPIIDFDSKCKYIATQGPMSNTVESFWQMVWEQGSSVIVALTRPIENGINMCHHYWPVEGSVSFSDFEIYLIAERLCSEDFLIRSFYLKNSQTMEMRTVTQFHFLTWEEFSNPPKIKGFLDFRREIKKFHSNESAPIVVHCNDGTGRTGTFILIDMILNQFEKETKEINVIATLEYLRNQRARMIKIKEQYEFVFVILAEELKGILQFMNTSK